MGISEEAFIDRQLKADGYLLLAKAQIRRGTVAMPQRDYVDRARLFFAVCGVELTG